MNDNGYGVAKFSRIDKITGLFCKRALQKRRYSTKAQQMNRQLTSNLLKGGEQPYDRWLAVS